MARESHKKPVELEHSTGRKDQSPLDYVNGGETGYNFDTGTIIGQPLNLGLDDPQTNGIPTNWHREHNFVLSGNYLVPHTSWRDNDGLMVAWIFRYMTGEQTTLFDNSARLDNSNRAPAAAGNYQGGFGKRYNVQILADMIPGNSLNPPQFQFGGRFEF